MATDLPDPTSSDVTLKLFDLKNDKIRDLKLQQVAPLGHQDPAWRPDGGRLLYVLNDRDGAKGTPRIYAWNPDTENARPVTGPGYLHPSWSPDGRYIAATKTSAFGTDVVILSASTGAELARLTNDGQSWAPAWSPRGDQVAYLHVAGQVTDLRMAQLEGSGPTWTVKETLDLTTAAGLDGVSRPDWFVPPEERPAATPPPSPADSPSPS
jgi:TolB protein